jgi:superfamily II DNA or RNA helicase
LTLQLHLASPSRLRLSGFNPQQIVLLKSSLTYKDQKVFFEYRKFKHAVWFAHKHGQEAYDQRLEELKQAVNKCLLFEDEQGLWTWSGLTRKIERLFPEAKFTSDVTYPEQGLLGWDQVPPYKPHAYQEDSKTQLIAYQHAGVEIGTGLGKSLIIYNLLKHYGLKSVVMAPSKDIANKLYEECLRYFGPKKVGFFGDGKKKSSKLITIAIAQSLTRIEPGSEHWVELSKAKVFMADESHQCPASTLAKVCFGLVENAPYRFFFSATQIRNDGLDLLLEAITGPIVYRMTVKEGIEQGYLARLVFTMIKTTSNKTFDHGDVNEMTRQHLYYNDRVIKQAATMANHFVDQQKCRVLILVEELEQFAHLYPLLKHPVKFAHGGVTKENAGKIPKPFHDSDPSMFVKEFNCGEFPILVGTSCITTGTDIKANEVTIYLQGGKSEIQVMQGPCGRSTRLFEFADGHKKTTCRVIDFDVENIEDMHRHAQARKSLYEQVAPVHEVTYG